MCAVRLTDLNPRFLGAGGDGISNSDGTRVPIRTGVGLMFDCPHGAACPSRQGVEFPEYAGVQYVSFANPLDGGPPFNDETPKWERTGDTFDTLTLRPSILSTPGKGGCGWHGFITAGEVITA